LIGPVFKGFGLEFGILGGSWKKGNCCALDWEIIFIIKGTRFWHFGFYVANHGWYLSIDKSGEQREFDPISLVSVIKVD
jgi:hypothetical protein